MIKKLVLCLSLIITAVVSFLKVKALKLIWIPIVTFFGSYVGIIIVLVLFIWLISLTINMKKDYNKQNKFHLFIFNSVLEALIDFGRIKVIVKGIEKVPKDEKYLLVMNHKSRFDPIIQCYILRKTSLVQISKPENFKLPIAGPFMKRCCFLAVDRENNRNALKTIVKSIKFIEEQKYSVGIAPEGTRNFGDGLLPFKSGSFKIATKAKCPLVICTMKNTFDVHKNFPFKKTIVEMNIVDVISYEEHQDLNTHQLALLARRKMVEDLGINETYEESENNIA